jgi:hypothetical protein
MAPQPSGLDLPALSFCMSAIDHAVPGPWMEHTPFALHIVDALRPRVLVELGTYSGTSYCAFCQAIDALDLKCRAVAIDTWEGDIHGGYYEKSVLENLAQYHDVRYSRFSTLLKSTFDAAVGDFEDESIDLLHIDGLHTYEAVRHDFETWFPKLSSRAIVLFHDTQVQSFGVWQFWEQMQDRYPSFEFTHGYGLGVLGVGSDLPPTVAHLFDKDVTTQDHYRRIFQTLGEHQEPSVADQQQLAQLRRSWSWRIGRVATAPGRLLRRLVA